MEPIEKSRAQFIRLHFPSTLFKFFGGRCCVDHAVDHFEWYSIKKLAAGARWSSDAFAAVRLIVRIMGLAHEIAAVFGEELIINPIHRHRHMPAAIQVSVKLTLIVDHETFFIGAPNR